LQWARNILSFLFDFLRILWPEKMSRQEKYFSVDANFAILLTRKEICCGGKELLYGGIFRLGVSCSFH
jgi:hypothetical protein